MRRSAAGNPNTSGAVLAELAKDSDWSVRSSTAGNPNSIDPSIRMRILSSLDEKFKEVFGR